MKNLEYAYFQVIEITNSSSVMSPKPVKQTKIVGYFLLKLSYTFCLSSTSKPYYI